MGGFGSGRKGHRATVEDGLILNGTELLAVAMKDIRQGAQYTAIVKWNSGENIEVNINQEKCMLFYLNAGDPVNVSIPLTDTPQSKGGRRYWFQCPTCGRRCGNLYLPRNAVRFACRLCYRLTYKSCNRSHCHDRLYRVMGIAGNMIKKSGQKKPIDTPGFLM